MGAQQIGAEAVDEQDGHPPGAGEGRGEAERIGGQVAALHRDAERGRGAGQDVGEGGRAVAAARAGPAAAGRYGHGRAARTCRPVATSR